jgi:hypothetical protein
LIWICALTIFTLTAQTAHAADLATQAKRLGLEARLHPDQRDAKAQQLAALIKDTAAADKDALFKAQGDVQYALMLLCDRGVLETLSRDTVESVDDALESAFTLDEYLAGNRWEAMCYVQGFLNHDVTAAEIRAVRSRWENMTPAERAPVYPTYVHVIDVVTKPLSVWALATPEETTAALEEAVPLLKSMLLQALERGTAFHPPSHAALVLGPLFERWENHPVVTKHLGDRATFEALLTGRLVGAQPDHADFEPWQHAFFAYSGQYIANTLARMDVRSAVPTLQETLTIYQQTNARRRAIPYTQRALIALGDPTARAKLEAKGPDAITTAVWLARNATGQGRAYGENLLGKLLNCSPEKALNLHLQQLLESLN